MKINTGSAFLILLLSVCFSFGQEVKPARGQKPPPGNMSLLPGYEHQRLRGIDSDIGQISRKDGLVIRYDIGGMAGNMALSVSGQTRAPMAWSKVIKVRGEDLHIIYFTDGKLIATFERQYANFFAHTKKLDEVEDFLVMVMTYGVNEDIPAASQPLPGPPEKVERHQRGERWKAPPPGNISLLPGYESWRRQGIDSFIGEISKENGFRIGYDIGAMVCDAMTQRYTEDRRPWFREVRLRGDTFLLSWKQTERVTAAFVDGCANFSGDVKSTEDLIDFILMVMTYHPKVKAPAGLIRKK